MALVRLLSRLFNIRTNEWPRLLILYAMIFFPMIGIIWGEIIVGAAFLKDVGVEFLPWFFVVKALVSIPATAVYTAFADRVANHKLMVAIVGVSLAGIGTGVLLLAAGYVRLAYPLLFLLLVVPLDDIFVTHWYTYVGGFYDTRSAKRVIPILATASRAGAIVAGLSISVLNDFLLPIHIILLWMGMLAIMGLMAAFVPSLKASHVEAGHLDAARSAPPKNRLRGHFDNLYEGYRFVFDSVYLRWMAVSTLLMMLLMSLLDFRTSQILLTELGTVNAISDLTGRIMGIANLVIWPIQLFALGRIIESVGLGNANLIFPITTAIASTGLIRFPGLPAAGLAYIDRNVFWPSFRSPVDTLLYNAVPLRVKGRARAFIGGLVVPLAGGLGGVLLLLLPLLRITWPLPALIGLLAVGYVVTAVVIRKQYARALIAMLKQEDFSFLLSQDVSRFAAADPAMLAMLQTKLEESTSHELTAFMATLVARAGGQKATPILVAAARNAAEVRTRVSIVDTLIAADLRGDALHQLYTDFLGDPDDKVRLAAVAGLEHLAERGDPRFVEQMMGMMEDPNVDVRIRALSALVQAGSFQQFPMAVQVLDQVLASPDAHWRARGLTVLGRIGGEETVQQVARHLADQADEVRLEAAIQIERLTEHGISDVTRPVVTERMAGLVQDRVERVRQAALTVLGRIGTGRSREALVNALTDASPSVRATAVEALAQAGRAIIPLVHPKLSAPDPQLREMAAVTLSRVDPKEFGPLVVGSSIMGNLLTIYQHYGLVEALSPCSNNPVTVILQRTLEERNRGLVDQIFFLLGAVYSADSVQVISHSLRSEQAYARANAAEALESLTSPQTASLIARLFEPNEPRRHLLKASKDAWDMDQPTIGEAFKQLVSHPTDPWLRSMAVYALAEVGAGHMAPARPRQEPQEPSGPGPTPGKVVPTSSGESPEQKPRAGRRGSSLPANLLGALGEPKEPESKGGRRSGLPANLLGALGDSKEPEPERREGRRGSSLPAEIAGAPGERKEPEPKIPLPLSLAEIEALLQIALSDSVYDVRRAAQTARHKLGAEVEEPEVKTVIMSRKEPGMLSAIEKIIFLKEVPFFQGMTVDQLRVLADVCEEQFFAEDTRIFCEGDPGGTLYVVVSGRVGIEQEKRAGSFARLADVGAHSYFGEMNLFDNSPHSTAAIALQDTLTLRLRREPLIALARQYPDLSLELINVLSSRLREVSDRIAELTRTRPRVLHKFFDQFDESA